MKEIIKLSTFSILLIALIFILSSCANTDNNLENKTNKEDKLKIMVSILPQVEFVEKIGGDKVEVKEMIPPGFSPATYNPSPKQLMILESSDIYFRIGYIAFEESQMDKIININPDMKVVDTSKDLNLEKISDNDQGVDPHIWLSPILVKEQAKHIYEALVLIKPEYKDYFAKNYQEFIKDLDELDSKLDKSFSSIEGETIFVFHPAFGYLAKEYNFEQKAIELDGKDPSPKHIQNIIKEAKKENVKAIFVQKQFSDKSAKKVAQGIGGVVVKIDPLAKDYFQNLENISNMIVNKLK